jgi:hypothetical protein
MARRTGLGLSCVPADALGDLSSRHAQGEFRVVAVDFEAEFLKECPHPVPNLLEAPGLLPDLQSLNNTYEFNCHGCQAAGFCTSVVGTAELHSRHHLPG